jgi:glycosyltransferase involved in cell wall biosynthesis
MRIAMVNDCAYVGETILKYLPENIEKTRIKRSRGLWSKTLGIAYKIWRAKADVYHVHYLLQDCYLASFLGKKPLIGHAHGSDLTATLSRFSLGRIVRSNLKKCDKILVSTPNLVEIVRRFREDVEYLPAPVDMNLFYPKPQRTRKDVLRVLIASGADWSVKDTDVALQAIASLKDKVEASIIQYGKDLEKTLRLAKSLNVALKLLPRVEHQNMNNYYWSTDLVLDQFKVGTFGVVTLEAIACGRPAITFVSSKYEAYKDFPLKDINDEEKIVKAFQTDRGTLWKAEHAYLTKNHDPKKIASRALKIYEDLVETKKSQQNSYIYI